MVQIALILLGAALTIVWIAMAFDFDALRPLMIALGWELTCDFIVKALL